MLVFRQDDLAGEAVRALVGQHLAEMHANTPEGKVHALGLDVLKRPEVTFWSAWSDETLCGCVALKDLGDARGEIKSMRVAESFRNRGIGRTLVDHVIDRARARGMKSLWLETGASDAFAPAVRLYERAGFRRCGPFEGYEDDPFSVFLTRAL